MSREAVLALDDAIRGFRRDELDLDELLARVAECAGALDADSTLRDELRRLQGALEPIALGVCAAERRGVVLEQLEPVGRLLDPSSPQ